MDSVEHLGPLRAREAMERQILSLQMQLANANHLLAVAPSWDQYEKAKREAYDNGFADGSAHEQNKIVARLFSEF